VTNEITISKSKDKAETLNQQFYSVFTDEDLSSVPSSNSSFPIVPNISFYVEGIYRLLNNLNIYKSPGPDKIATNQNFKILCYRDSSNSSNHSLPNQ